MDNTNKIRFATVAKTELPTFEETNSRKGYVNWGKRNDFPNELFSLYNQCPVLSSIVASIRDYVVGNGIEFDSFREDGTVNRKGDTIDTLVMRIVIDLVIFGGFAIEVKRNKFKKIAELNWIDTRNVRISEDGERVYVSKSFSTQKSGEIFEFPVFRPDSNDNTSILFEKGLNSRGVYPQPDWVGALKDVKILAEISNYNLNNILNNFTPSAIFNFNNGSNLPEDVMDEIETKIYEKFVGTDCAGRFMLSFNDDREHGLDVERLQDDGLETKYSFLAEQTMKNVYSAFRINPVLLGYNQENIGFNTQEFESAFQLFNKTVIQPIQRKISNVFGKKLKLDTPEFIPFSISFNN